MQVDGRGIARDHPAAKALFLRAASAGHAGAMFALGALQGGGHDIEPDPQEARRGFALAAEAGHPMAALMLARYAARGIGGPCDSEAGAYWYAQAGARGLAGDADEWAALEPEVTPARHLEPPGEAAALPADAVER